MRKITPVILSGGSGTRLWPLSRSLNPKQFLNIFGSESLFFDTVKRVQSDEFNDISIICNHEHRFIVGSKLQEKNIKPNSIILEPVARNTAPAIAVAAFDVIKKLGKEDDAMLIMPSDHIIKDNIGFINSVKKSLKAIDDFFITFGIVATSANTGYGYIKNNSKIKDLPLNYVDKFVEKPNEIIAEKYYKSGQYHWNSGIFMFRASKYLSELKKLKPEIYNFAKKSYENSVKDMDFIRLDKDNFEKCEDISIDYAVMEELSKNKKIAVANIDVGWDDVGNFDAVANNTKKDKEGNNLIGDIATYDAKDCYINSQDGLTAVIGVRDLIIVNLRDVVLVAHKKNAQDVKKLYQELKKKNRPECETHTKVLRPWGSFEVLDDCSDKGFKVKRIIVKPNCSLSLQLHHKRSEHWVVVKGKALITVNDKEFYLSKGQSTFIKKEQKHRLENKTDKILEIIEIQTGSYLGEDDIVRFEDIYGRDK